jgi:MYXO-CTERM domain-containing protein
VRLAALLLLLSPLSARAATVTLAWDPPTTNTDGTPVDDLGGYKVYYGTVNTPPYKGTGAKEGASPITVPLSAFADPSKPVYKMTVPSCLHLYFTVTAYDTSGNESDYSNSVDKTIAPTVEVTVEPDDDGTLALAWTGLSQDDPGAISGYAVFYGLTEDSLTVSGKVEGQVTSAELSNLKADTTYYVAVEAVCPDGTAKRSKVVSAITGGPGGTRPYQGGCSVAASATPTDALASLALLVVLLAARRRSR